MPFSDDTEDDDQYGEEEINCNEYDDDDFYNSDDQYNGRNQLSDYASEGTNRTDSEEESFNSNVVDSLGGKTKLWKPIVPKDFMPDVDAIYQSLEEAVEMYKLYADKACFGVRLNTVTRFGDKTIKKRYVVCNKMGKIPNRSTDTLDPEGSGRNKRNSNFKITDCKALIKFERLHMQTNACKIYEFEENHNHPLETKEERRYKDKEFIVRSSTSNIGATKAHKLQAILQGGYENVGPEAIDYKNFRRKVGNIIGDKDAQLVVDKMNMRKDELHNYTFEYKCVDSVLNAMFWADETDKLYYKEFGDVISFDATFRTNKYGMIFVPFTAIDNHKRSINIGAGLLSNESIESYRWLLEAFLKAHVKHPQLVLTDQDPAILQAVEAIFPTSNHRLCMWHNMKKLQAKVSADFLKNTDFRKCFTKLVWNVYIEPEVFESRWKLLMRKFKPQDKRWFKDMYRDQKLWIPAYFKDMPLHGLMKTTSTSESVNSFFNKYSNSEHDTKNAKHEMTLPSVLLEHAAAVKKEIFKAVWYCSIDSVEKIDGWQVVMITQTDKSKQLKIKYKVELKLPEKEVKCSCNHFIRTGILCRHIFAVLKNNHIEEIPEQLIGIRNKFQWLQKFCWFSRYMISNWPSCNVNLFLNFWLAYLLILLTTKLYT
uniref:SWIM-type domain-containing protein n=1 Tax=Lactuca sativa TaxID=4236 RepID=A0A9R1VPC5_LACSA|nr:hypothetical protein LSAT_V11C400207320 [Lactuca sativa]